MQVINLKQTCRNLKEHPTFYWNGNEVSKGNEMSKGVGKLHN